MPVFRVTEEPPAWGEVEHVEIVRLRPGETCAFERRAPKEKVFVGEGAGTVTIGSMTWSIAEGEALDWSRERSFAVLKVARPLTLVRVAGRWGEETGPCGVFTLDNSFTPGNAGDPRPYPRTTDFDCHYHDCDEYWILFDGHGLAVTEGAFFEVSAGDCVATRRGCHHDFPLVFETVRGVYFETTLTGQKRRGHLWEHTHGPARPSPSRSASA